MRTRRRTRMLMAAAAAVVLLTATGCGWSPTMDQWIERGLTGCEIERANWAQVEQQLLKGLDARDAKSLDALFADIALARDKMLEDLDQAPTTQPASRPASRWLDDEWISSSKKGMVLQLGAMKSERQALAAQIRKANANVDELEKAFRMTDKLRKSWGPNADLKANVEYMSTLLEALLKKEPN